MRLNKKIITLFLCILVTTTYIKGQKKLIENEKIAYLIDTFVYTDTLGKYCEKHFVLMPQVDSIMSYIKSNDTIPSFLPGTRGLKPFGKSYYNTKFLFDGLDNPNTDFFSNLALYYIHKKEIPFIFLKKKKHSELFVKYDKQIIEEWRLKYKQNDIIFWSKIYNRKKGKWIENKK